jgi:thiol-disulfide isomerase/thioredoxin
MSDTGGFARERSASSAEPPPDPEKVGTARALVVVLTMAVGFALVPRMTRGCEGISLAEEAPDFDARIVANGESVLFAPPADGETPAPPLPTRLELKKLRGHPVVLDFWATWCGPCQAESPIVNAIAQRYKDKGLAVVGVNTSDEDGLAAAFAKRKGLRFAQVYDEGNLIAKRYGVTTLPTLIVVSKTGKVVAVRNGVTSDAALDEIIRRYL